MYGVTKIELAAKKKSLHSSERESERVVKKRDQYQEQIKRIEVARFKFLDEAGSNIAMTSKYGRAKPGERVTESVPKNYGVICFDGGGNQSRRSRCSDDDFGSG